MSTQNSLNLEAAREQMIEHQIRGWEVLNPRILDTLRQVPRERFVPAGWEALAFADTDLPLAHGERMLAPNLQGRLLQALDIQPGERVLEVGTGTGFLTACLASLGGEVHSVDIHEDFTREARGAVHRLGLREAHFETRDASRLDWVKTPYDAIAVTGSMPELEPGFLHALSVGGRLFTVLGTAPAMEAMLITRTAEDDWARESLFETVIPPLVNAYNPPRFAF